jgi:putative ABC transport system permease protein
VEKHARVSGCSRHFNLQIMYMLRLAYVQLKAKAASSLLSLLLFAIGMAMISFLLLTRQKLDQQLSGNLAGIDLVAGAKGSPIQIILSSVMHIDYPTGNISLAEAGMISRNPLVRQTIPIALGDNYMGFRIVGTTADLPDIYEAELLTGRMYGQAMEAIIGAQVADQTGLTINATFTGVHGFQSVGHTHGHYIYTVTGVLKPTGTVIDRLILTPVESVWLVHDTDHTHDSEHSHSHHQDHEGHDHHSADHGHGHDHGLPGQEVNHAPEHHHSEDTGPGHIHLHNEQDEQLKREDPDQSAMPVDDHPDIRIANIRQLVEAGEDISEEDMAFFLQHTGNSFTESIDHDGREITALLIFYRSPAAAVQLPRLINETTNMQAASPAIEVNRLLAMLGFGFNTLRLLAWIIILISAVHVFVNLVNTLRQSLFQMALMRVMGSSKTNVFVMILSQGMMLAGSGWLAGIVLSRIIWLMLPLTHLFPGSTVPGLLNTEVLLLLYALLVGLFAAIIPAWKAYQTDIHYTLIRKNYV